MVGRNTQNVLKLLMIDPLRIIIFVIEIPKLTPPDFITIGLHMK